eukprot:169155-Hanusia_phi.AAC.2
MDEVGRAGGGARSKGAVLGRCEGRRGGEERRGELEGGEGTAERQPLHWQPVQRSLRPERREEGRHDERAEDGGEHGLAGLDGPEGAVEGAAGEESQEVGERDVEVDHRNDLAVLHGRDSETREGSRGVVGIESRPEQKEG